MEGENGRSSPVLGQSITMEGNNESDNSAQNSNIDDQSVNTGVTVTVVKSDKDTENHDKSDIDTENPDKSDKDDEDPDKSDKDTENPVNSDRDTESPDNGNVKDLDNVTNDALEKENSDEKANVDDNVNDEVEILEKHVDVVVTRNDDRDEGDDDLPPAPEEVEVNADDKNGIVDEDVEVPPPPPDTELPEDPPSYNDVQKDEEENEQPEKEVERELTPEPEPEPEVEPEPVVIATSPPSENHPRLCHLVKVPDFNGYGFNLHGEKDVQGQYIGVVDDDSPAAEAGLKKGDRIVEVNGMNIEQSTHQDVIMKIKAGGNTTKLLVVDKETDDYYKNNRIPISSSSSDVVSKCNIDKDEIQDEEPAMEFSPRLCHIVKWHDFNGYGFNLHAEKEKGAQYIGKIDDNSPAQDGGLKERDRIIEVNGVNIEDESHRQVISRIKEGGDETKLLVVDQEADNYFKSRGITVTSSMPNVRFLQTTRKAPGVTGVTNGESRPTRTEPVTNSASAVQANGGGDFLSMNLSAKEMRERIAAKKKMDPKQRSNMDFKSKYDMFQKL